MGLGEFWQLSVDFRGSTVIKSGLVDRQLAKQVSRQERMHRCGAIVLLAASAFRTIFARARRALAADQGGRLRGCFMRPKMQLTIQ
jgi:hypothetical protein